MWVFYFLQNNKWMHKLIRKWKHIIMIYGCIYNLTEAQLVQIWEIYFTLLSVIGQMWYTEHGCTKRTNSLKQWYLPLLGFLHPPFKHRFDFLRTFWSYIQFLKSVSNINFNVRNLLARSDSKQKSSAMKPIRVKLIPNRGRQKYRTLTLR